MMDLPYPVRRLEPGEFAAALRKGQGRALQHVLAHGLDDVADLVLEACLHDQRYDKQAESGRAGWLFQMFGASKLYPRFHEAILEQLKTATEAWDALQLLGLAKEMAAQGDGLARQTLGKAVRERAGRVDTSDDGWGADLWVELEGPQGWLQLARIYGQRLRSNPDDSVPDYILRGDDRALEYRETLLRSAETEPETKAYADYLEARGVWKAQVVPPQPIDREALAARYRERIRTSYTLERILTDAKNHASEVPGRYYRFGRYATQAELDDVYQHIWAETDGAARLRLMWVFRGAELPRLADEIFDWANGADDALRAAAIAALSNSRDERVHALARAKFQSGDLVGPDSEASNLFLKNYVPSDAILITQALRDLEPGPVDAHNLGFSLISLAEQYHAAALAPALLWVYENAPCANCRRRALLSLAEFQNLAPELLQECLYDSEEDIRAFARAHQRSQDQTIS